MKNQCINFNQDFSCVAVGTSSGYKIYNCDPFGECFSMEDSAGASIIEMLFSTSLIAVVGTSESGSHSKKLKIINTKRKSTICELSFFTPVLNVKLNRKRLVVVLIDQILIYDVSCMQLLHAIETSRNPTGMIALSLSDDSIFAYPAPTTNFQNVGGNSLSDVVSTDSNATNSSSGSDKTKVSNGTIVIFDAMGLQPISAIVAHKAEIATMSLNSEGTLVATASTKGTIIRVFETSSGRKIAEFRRGMAGTMIHSLNFNLDSSLLCSSSNNQTIHIFKLGGVHHVSQDLEEVNELHRTNTESSTSSLSSRIISNLENAPESQTPSATDETLINQLLMKKRSSSISGLLWKKSKKISNVLMNNYLPQQITSILEPVRHFAFIKLPKEEGDEEDYKSVVALSHGSSYVMIASGNGKFYLYNVPLEKGGECVQVNQYNLV